jgi:hypothetical protein
MRPELLAGGLLVMALGALLFVVALPFLYFWSIPFVVGGAFMAVASLFLAEGRGPVTPPPGYRFCVFCTAPVPENASRCPRCNGLQPTGGR